jgi:hypothetical protein
MREAYSLETCLLVMNSCNLNYSMSLCCSRACLVTHDCRIVSMLGHQMALAAPCLPRCTAKHLAEMNLRPLIGREITSI